MTRIEKSVGDRRYQVFNHETPKGNIPHASARASAGWLCFMPVVDGMGCPPILLAIVGEIHGALRREQRRRRAKLINLISYAIALPFVNPLDPSLHAVQYGDDGARRRVHLPADGEARMAPSRSSAVWRMTVNTGCHWKRRGVKNVSTAPFPSRSREGYGERRARRSPRRASRLPRRACRRDLRLQLASRCCATCAVRGKRDVGRCRRCR